MITGNSEAVKHVHVYFSGVERTGNDDFLRRCGEVGPLSSFFACPDSGKLFNTYEASLEVKPPAYIDPRKFYCPVCDALLKITVGGEPPVARCSSCSWTTDGSSITSIPDMLTCEANPYPNAKAEFDDLRRLASSTSQKALTESLQKVPTGIETRSIEEFCTYQEKRESIAREPVSDEDNGSEQLHALRTTPPEFYANITSGSVLRRDEKLEHGIVFRSSMAPHRRKSNPIYVLRSPFTNESVLPLGFNTSLIEAPSNASMFIPHMTARWRLGLDSVTICVTLQNVTDARAEIRLSKPREDGVEQELLTWTWKSDHIIVLDPRQSRDVALTCDVSSFHRTRDTKSIELIEIVRFSPFGNHLWSDQSSVVNFLSRDWSICACIEIPRSLRRI